MRYRHQGHHCWCPRHSYVPRLWPIPILRSRASPDDRSPPSMTTADNLFVHSSPLTASLLPPSNRHLRRSSLRQTLSGKASQLLARTTSELLHGAESADTAFSVRQRGSAQPLAVSTGARYTAQHAQHNHPVRYAIDTRQQSLVFEFW